MSTVISTCQQCARTSEGHYSDELYCYALPPNNTQPSGTIGHRPSVSKDDVSCIYFVSKTQQDDSADKIPADKDVDTGVVDAVDSKSMDSSSEATAAPDSDTESEAKSEQDATAPPPPPPAPADTKKPASRRTAKKKG